MCTLGSGCTATIAAPSSASPATSPGLPSLRTGTLLLTLKNPWKDGTRAIVLEPDTLMARLCAAVPPPRFHMLRYFGVLSSHSKHRAEVVPKPPDDDADRPPPAPGDQLELPDGVEPDSTPRAPRKRWGFLLRKVFRADVDHCPHCGGAMRWLEVATTADAIARALADQRPRAPPAGPRPVPEQLGLPFMA